MGIRSGSVVQGAAIRTADRFAETTQGPMMFTTLGRSTFRMEVE